MRYITVCRTGQAAVFEPTRNAVDLAGKFREFPYGGAPIGPRRIWQWSEPAVANLFAGLIEDEGLPWLRQAVSLREHMHRVFETDAHKKAWAAAYAKLLLLLGDLDEARDVLQSSEVASRYWFPELDRLGLRDRILSEGANLDHEDRRTLAEYFHELELGAVKALKIEHLWEPTPFPLEERAPGE
jgi:hypothetical protein